MSGMKGDGTWQTSDLGTAAYVHMRGLEIAGCRQVPRGRHGAGKFVFVFRDPEGRGPELSVDYVNSECRRFDAAVRSMKKLCYDSEPSRASGGR